MQFMVYITFLVEATQKSFTKEGDRNVEIMNKVEWSVANVCTYQWTPTFLYGNTAPFLFPKNILSRQCCIFHPFFMTSACHLEYFILRFSQPCHKQLWFQKVLQVYWTTVALIPLALKMIWSRCIYSSYSFRAPRVTIPPLLRYIDAAHTFIFL